MNEMSHWSLQRNHEIKDSQSFYLSLEMSPNHSLLTELLVAESSVLHTIYMMPRNDFIKNCLLFCWQKSCYKQEVCPVGFRRATSNSVNRLCNCDSCDNWPFKLVDWMEFQKVYPISAKCCILWCHTSLGWGDNHGFFNYPASTRRQMDVRVLCSMDVSNYDLMSSFMNGQQ